MWLTDYHVDGLRLDAVHALHDTRATHLLEELDDRRRRASSAFLGRPLSLIAESDLNDPRLITAREAGGYGLTAQWSDDFHHALYVSLTGDTSGYYADFDSLGRAGQGVRPTGFFHTGTTPASAAAATASRSTPPDPDLAAGGLLGQPRSDRQPGRRRSGCRPSSTAGQLEIAAMVTLLSPFTPMIFMGEEWGARTPWQFFTSHPEPELAERWPRAGRRRSSPQMDWDTRRCPTRRTRRPSRAPSWTGPSSDAEPRRPARADHQS